MPMRPRIVPACLSTVFLLLCCASFGNEKTYEKARPILKGAADRALFRADASAPFMLMLSFTLRSPDSKPVQGKYSWLVTADGDWRKETTFLDYADLEIKRGSSLWVKRSVGFRPLQAAWVENAFTNYAYLNRAEDSVERYFTTSDNHVALRCIDLSREKTSQTACFDPEDNVRSYELKALKLAYEYSDYRPLGQKFAPHKIIARRDGHVVLEGVVEELSPVVKVDPSRLTPPVGAVQRGGCLAPTLPKLKEKVVPEYPGIARFAHQQGSVFVYALILSDGTVKDPVVIQTAGQAFDSSVLTAVRRWQFEPAKCGDTPVEYETEIPVNFTLEIR
jgi:TonB family protein